MQDQLDVQTAKLRQGAAERAAPALLGCAVLALTVVAVFPLLAVPAS